MRCLFYVIFLLFLSSCSVLPVFEGDFKKFQGEVKNQLEETKGKIAENAGVIHEAIVSEKDVATVITQRHSQQISDWASEEIEFTAPSQGMDLMNLIMMLLGGGTLLGGGGAAIRKISNLKDTVKTVAGMDSKHGIEEARRRGVVV